MSFNLAAVFLLVLPITGTVKDTAGGGVAGATVVALTANGARTQTTTGPDGRFTLDVDPAGADVVLIVRAPGFAETTTRIGNAQGAAAVELVVAPAPVLETVTVTPTRTGLRSGDVPASVDVITRDEIRASPARVADDLLRQLPAFSLFRRASSVSSHPTTQGVSLRGIGPSGVSRTLVLFDGVPANDPFGGWVYWTRIPLDAIERVEVVEGPGSSLYGNYAIGGVIHLSSIAAAQRTLSLDASYGTRNSPRGSVFAADRYGAFGIAADVSAFDTGGFPIVAPGERGPIDNDATVAFSNANLKVDYAPVDRVRVFARAGRFSERRGNGKIGDVNDTRWTSLSGGASTRFPNGSHLSATVFGDLEEFHSTFLAIAPASATVAPRSIDRLTLDQRVPTHAAGGSLEWGTPMGVHNSVSAGADWHWVQGDSDEAAYDAAPGPIVPPTQGAVLSLNRISGGRQQLFGAFVQDVFAPAADLTITASARVDRWSSYDAHNLETAVLPAAVVNNRPSLPDRADAAVSARAGARYQLARALSIWGAIASGFRAPTLNELYRQFRVGTVLTLANDQLGPERLVGAEGGIALEPARSVSLRATWFDNHVHDPVANVTLTSAGASVTQQRQNLGATRIDGLQADVDYRVGAAWKVSAGYLFSRARVVDGGASNAALVGNALPQAPGSRGSAAVTYAGSRTWTASASLRVVGAQFDDDQNTRSLAGYALVDAFVSKRISGRYEAYLAVDNLFDREYVVGTLPTTIGSPRLVNAGVRVRVGAR